jgi:hypothetical protein
MVTLKHYRFYDTRPKRRTTRARRIQKVFNIKWGLGQILELKCRDKIIVTGHDGSPVEMRDSLTQKLGRAGIHCYSSWSYSHLATDNQDAIFYIEQNLPAWSRILKRPGKCLSRRLANRDYENHYYG